MKLDGLETPYMVENGWYKSCDKENGGAKGWEIWMFSAKC